MCKNQAFSEGMCDLISVDDVDFSNRLQRVYTGSVSFSDLQYLQDTVQEPAKEEISKILNLAETPLSDDGHQFKVIDRQRLAVMWLIRHPNLDLSRAACQIVPLIMVAHSIEIRHKLDAAQENIVSKVIRYSVPLPFWFLCP